MDPDLIYLDCNATTRVDPRVFEAMRPWMLERFGNAASRQHALGRAAARAVEEARERVAASLGADPREIVWTSGATESDNLALKGTATAPAYRGRRHIVVVRTEHRAVLDPARRLEEEGWSVTRLGVDADGHLDLDELAAVLREDTLLVSAMAANNETGVLHPLGEIGALCRERGVLFHTDATQAVGKVALDVGTLPVDLLSFSAHKFHGPKGVGALFVRRRRPRVRIRPLQEGGGHERGLRSGTLDVPGIVGLATALEIAISDLEAEAARLRGLRDRLEEGMSERLSGVRLNGDRVQRLPQTSNLSFAGIEAEALLARLPRLCASSSSACTSAAHEPSHVLRAMGFSEERVASSVRFSLGRFTTSEEIDAAIELVVKAIEAERAEGPRRSCTG